MPLPPLGWKGLNHAAPCEVQTIVPRNRAFHTLVYDFMNGGLAQVVEGAITAARAPSIAIRDQYGRFAMTYSAVSDAFQLKGPASKLERGRKGPFSSVALFRAKAWHFARTTHRARFNDHVADPICGPTLPRTMRLRKRAARSGGRPSGPVQFTCQTSAPKYPIIIVVRRRWLSYRLTDVIFGAPLNNACRGGMGVVGGHRCL